MEKNNDNKVYYVSDLLYIELSIIYDKKTGQTENAEVIQIKNILRDNNEKSLHSICLFSVGQSDVSSRIVDNRFY
ncbi:hypothetical protein H0R94_02325 [Treponema socranskii]|uniref:hypothetical protein n=1 Tax=Treponema socranskii TaxID=53419 RepID=UPI003D8DC165